MSVETIRINFKTGDMAVHPAHGVGEVQDIEEKDFGGGKKTACYVIKIRDTGLKVMIPTEAVQRVGLRPVMNRFRVVEAPCGWRPDASRLDPA